MTYKMENLNTRTNKVINSQAVKEKITVLMVDNKQIDTVLENNIMTLGNRVIVAECYRNAIQAATNTESDLITISMNLSGQDSSRLISKIKKVVGASNVVSSDMFEDDTGRNKENQQILYYVVKPLEVNDIQSILGHISNRKMGVYCLPH